MKKYIILVIVLSVFVNNIAFSQSADKYLIKAGILSDMKLFEEASSAISLTTAVDNKNYYKIMGDINYGLKNFQAAIESYNKLSESDNASLYLDLARCNAMLDNRGKAIDNLKKYLGAKSKLPISKVVNDEAFLKYKNNTEWDNIWQNVEYSEVEKKVNQLKSASEIDYNQYFSNILEDALIKYPNNPELLYQQSKYLESKNLLDAAQKSINLALEQRSGNDLYHYQNSLLLLRKQSNKEALTSINNAIKRNPFSLKYYLTRIEINKALRNTDQVNEDVNFLNFCAPDYPEVRLAKAKIEIDKGNYLTALNEVNSLIIKDQSKAEYFILRGKIGLKSLKIQNADEDFGMALDLNPVNAEANLGKGIAKFKLEDASSACYYWQKASNEGSREAMEYLNKYCIK